MRRLGESPDQSAYAARGDLLIWYAIVGLKESPSVNIELPEDVAVELQDLAVRQNTEIGDILRDLLDRRRDEPDNGGKRWATLADLARHAKLMNMASPQPVDTADRSREILNTEFADYLKGRVDP